LSSSGGAGFLIGGFAQKKFEHQSKNTAVFRKGFQNQKYGRHKVLSVLNSPQKILNPKGFATQSVAQKRQFDP